jgi:hypothetical protein
MKKPGLYFLPVLLSFFQLHVFSQCMVVPVSLNERVTNSDVIVEGVVSEKETFLEPSTGAVYTMNKIDVKAWLKNKQQTAYIYTRTEGGVYKNRATTVYPSLQLQQNGTYVLFLNKTAAKKENAQLRMRNAAIAQTTPYAGIQGAFTETLGLFTDVLQNEKQTETVLLQKIKLLTGQEALTPDGKRYQPTIKQSTLNRTMAITSISPSTVRAGTTDAADEVTITGSGFGATAGTVYFSNADNGGATFIASGLSSDIINWSDNSITVKVLSAAGTGPVNINGTFMSPTNLTVQYAHLAVEHDFFGFASVTRQRYLLRNLNGSGGYTFQLNNSFAANTDAATAFYVAVNTWRNATHVNFTVSGTTSVATSANDGVNAVYFNPAIAAGTLAVCTSNFNAAATAGCTQENTVWWLSDMDIQFKDVPTAGTTWQYGPGAPTAAQYDFQSVALHELGHAHGLGHVIAPGEVMHYAIANGATARMLSTNDIAAGTAKLDYSDDPACFNPTGSGTEMEPVSPGGGTLPITLRELKGKRINKNQALLTWGTVQEFNNDGFVVERGETASSFQQIGFVKGKELSLSPVDYQFTDDKAGPYGWYYRLIQRDMSGHYVGSAVVFVKADETKTWRVWTNETGQTVQVYLQQLQNKQVQLQIFNTTGQLVLTKTITTNRTVLPVQHLQKGYYSYRLTDGADIISGKLFFGH